MNVCVTVPKAFDEMTLSDCFSNNLFFFPPHFGHILLTFLVKEEKSRLLKERLDQMHFVNDRRCSQAPVYGRDLLRICSLPGRRKRPLCWSLDNNLGKVSRAADCYTSASKSKGDLIVTLSQRQESLQDVLDR